MAYDLHDCRSSKICEGESDEERMEFLLIVFWWRRLTVYIFVWASKLCHRNQERITAFFRKISGTIFWAIRKRSKLQSPLLDYNWSRDDWQTKSAILAFGNLHRHSCLYYGHGRLQLVSPRDATYGSNEYAIYQPAWPIEWHCDQTHSIWFRSWLTTYPFPSWCRSPSPRFSFEEATVHYCSWQATRILVVNCNNVLVSIHYTLSLLEDGGWDAS